MTILLRKSYFTKNKSIIALTVDEKNIALDLILERLSTGFMTFYVELTIIFNKRTI